jgi:Cu/Ag efflux protein CusF
MKHTLACSLALAFSMAAISAHAQAHKASGTVTKVDAQKGNVTIAHGPVQTMKWPAMTMTFKVKDKAALDKVKQGDKVDFSFVQSGKDYTITEMK